MPCPYIGSTWFEPSKLFWLDPNHFGQVQIRLFWTIFLNLVLNQNYLDSLNNFRTHRRTGQYSSKHIFFLHNNFQMEFLIFDHSERMKHWVKVNSNNLCSLKQVLFGLQKHMRFADPDSDKKLFILSKFWTFIKSQFYIQLVNRPHFGTWILLLGLFGQSGQ